MNVPRSGVFPRLDKRNLEGFENIWWILYVCQRGVLKKRIILKKCKKNQTNNFEETYQFRIENLEEMHTL